MKNLLKKFRENKKGFTLAELLVVVAIVGILVAISIPVFTAQLGKAREATNNANLRAAKAAAVSEYLTGENNNSQSGFYKYDVSTGDVEVLTADPSNGKTQAVINAKNNETGAVSKTTVYKTVWVVIAAKTVNDKTTDDITVTLYAE